MNILAAIAAAQGLIKLGADIHDIIAQAQAEKRDLTLDELNAVKARRDAAVSRWDSAVDTAKARAAEGN